MEILWWKILFTPQAIRHFCRDWQHSSSGAISSPYLWELSLIVASPGHRSQFTKVPLFGASDDHLWNMIYFKWF